MAPFILQSKNSFNAEEHIIYGVLLCPPQGGAF
jgi:hypothetical protein